MENDGSINKLIKAIKNEEEFEKTKMKKNKQFRAIIVTTSPLMEDLKLDLKRGIITRSTLVLYDQYITSEKDFQQRIDENNKKNIIIRLTFKLSMTDTFDIFLKNKKIKPIQLLFIMLKII